MIGVAIFAVSVLVIEIAALRALLKFLRGES